MDYGASRTKDVRRGLRAVEYCTYDFKSAWPQRSIVYLQVGGEGGGINSHKTSVTH